MYIETPNCSGAGVRSNPKFGGDRALRWRLSEMGYKTADERLSNGAGRRPHGTRGLISPRRSQQDSREKT